MKPSDVYRKAAKRIEIGYSEYCCPAICCAAEEGCICNMPHPLQVNFRRLFKPSGARAFWWPAEDKGSRVLALCFMAAIVENP